MMAAVYHHQPGNFLYNHSMHAKPGGAPDEERHATFPQLHTRPLETGGASRNNPSVALLAEREMCRITTTTVTQAAANWALLTNGNSTQGIGG